MAKTKKAKKATTAKRKYTCRACGKLGHNSRTCGRQ
jgi:hypothetical protein